MERAKPQIPPPGPTAAAATTGTTGAPATPPPPDRGPEAVVRAVEDGTLLPRLSRRADPAPGTPGATGLALDATAVATFQALEREQKSQPADVADALASCQKQLILWDVTRDELEVGDIEREPAIPADERPEWAAVAWIGPFPSTELAAIALASGLAQAAFAAYRAARDKAVREPYRRPEVPEGTEGGDADAMGFYMGLLNP